MPSIVPSGPSQDVFLVLDEFGGRLDVCFALA